MGDGYKTSSCKCTTTNIQHKQENNIQQVVYQTILLGHLSVNHSSNVSGSKVMLTFSTLFCIVFNGIRVHKNKESCVDTVKKARPRLPRYSIIDEHFNLNKK